MANMILTSGLILCLSAISCYGFLNQGKDLGGKAIGDFGCNGLSSPTNGLKGALSDASFSKSSKLNANYELKWNFNATHILFQAHVKTKGYLGLGISKKAAMFPSDIVIAYVDSKNVVHVSDRHAQMYGVPAVDTHQDWQLVNGSQDGDYTTVSVLRALDPCDEEDMPIKSGKNFVIYSFNQNDPTSEKGVAYHGINKGIAELDLLGN